MDNSIINNKTIAIITRHAVPNYGSFLQSYATQKVLEQLGYKASIVNYNRSDESTTVLARNYSTISGNSIKSRVYYNSLWRLSHLIACNKFMDARKKYLKETQYLDEKSLRTKLKKYSVYLTGSDQVWNKVGSGETEEIDENYFWNSIDEDNRIISYAASFGEKGLSEDDLKKCANWLKKYNHISVRENSGCDIIRAIGMDVQQVLDPVFLVGREFWSRMADSCTIRKKYRYLLVYNLHSSSRIDEAVQKAVDEKKYRIKCIGTTFRRTIGKKVFCPSVEEFLWYFKNADYIIADSFHATAFSIIFNKPFTVILPKQFSTRIESILSLFGLEDRAYSIGDKSFCLNKNIDWDRINKKVADERKNSIEWLKSALES